MDFGWTYLNSDVGSNDDYDPEYSDLDSCLNPVERLEKHAESEHMYNRQLAARSLLETFQQVEEFSDAARILKVLSTLANDADGVVRSELCECLAQIGNFCTESRALFASGDVSYSPLSNDILPIIFRYMTDPNNQIRRTGQTALTDLVEQRLVAGEDIASNVSPIISKLANMDSSEDHRSEAASLICRLAPFVAAELTEKLFLGHFLNLCADDTSHIRKICAVNLGSICQIVGREKTESLLLQRFFCLCTDAIWGVRKACAECFTQVSSICSPDVRHSHLSAVFMTLVADQSRWVRMSAFEALGGFISTFANRNTTGLLITEEGKLTVSQSTVALEEKRINGDLIENIEKRVDDFKEDLVATVDNTASVATEQQKVIEGSSSEYGITVDANNVKISAKDDDEMSCNYFKSSCVSQDSLITDNEVCNCEIATINPINCNGEHSDKSDVLTTEQQSFGNCDKESGSDSISEDCCGKEELLLNLNGVEIRSINNISASKIENDFMDKNLSVDSDISTAALLNAANLCQQNELTNGHADITIAVCLEDDLILTAIDKMTQQFESLTFLQKVEPGLGETSHPEIVNDYTGLPHVESSLDSCSDSRAMSSEAQNLLGSKLSDSVSHLVDSVDSEDGTSVADMPSSSSEFENGESRLCDQVNGESQASNNAQNFENLKENSRSELAESLDFNQSVKLQESCSIAAVNHVDENHIETVTGHKSQSLALISDLETDEIPLSNEFTDRNNDYEPILQLLNDLNCHKSTVMDIDDAIDIEYGIEVDEEEIHELVSAAKDMPCNNLAIYEQDVVPIDLLEQYISMVNPSCAEKVDSEVTRYCAYNFPAVAYTLGRENWSSIKTLYTALAEDVQWKVRRTLAFSIHELALIVGEEITSRDVVPVFDGFLNDIDEVRIGVLKHLADFLKLLPVESRHGYLLKIAELLKTDNSRNWRFFEELARQLILLLDLFRVVDVEKHIFPVALHLADDPVAQVRLAAVQVLSHILKHLVGHLEGSLEQSSVWTNYLDRLTEQFVRSKRSKRRQMYVHLCNCILQDRVVSDECFADKFLPALLSLRHDSVPNVRLALARTISQHIRHLEFFLSPGNPLYDEVTKTVVDLQEDRDRDVRFLIGVRAVDVEA